MTTFKILHVDTLRNLISYDCDTGFLTWKRRPVAYFSSLQICNAWNTRYAGRRAINQDNGHGRLIGSIFNSKYQAHRVAWAIHYGAWPELEIDHIDMNPKNNKISNLRMATSQENKRNGTSRSKSTSKYRGVSLNRKTGLWVANITISQKQKFLGRFACEIEAAVAYDQKAADVFGDFARLNFPR